MRFIGARSRGLLVWYVLLTLLAAEAVLYLAAGWAAGQARQSVRRQFAAAAALRQEVDKVPYAALINRYAGQEGLSAVLVAAVIRAESSFQPRAMSRAGAAGLMQVIPATWREVNGRIKACSGRHAGECGENCWFDPELNIRVGTAYLAELSRRYQGDAVLAVAAYNAGPAAVDGHGGVPPYAETQEYVERVMTFWSDYARVPLAGRGLTAGWWEEARRLSGWVLAATGALAAAAVAGLLRRHRSWRWR